MVQKAEDWLTPVAVVGGLGALAVGGYLMFKKKPQAAPGDTLEATFKFQYRGPADNYRLRVVLGRKGLIEFYEDEATRKEFPIELPECTDWEDQEMTVEYKIPIVTEDIKDAEFSIRYDDGSIVSGMRVIAWGIISAEGD